MALYPHRDLWWRLRLNHGSASRFSPANRDSTRTIKTAINMVRVVWKLLSLWSVMSISAQSQQISNNSMSCIDISLFWNKFLNLDCFESACFIWQTTAELQTKQEEGVFWWLLFKQKKPDAGNIYCREKALVEVRQKQPWIAIYSKDAYLEIQNFSIFGINFREMFYLWFGVTSASFGWFKSLVTQNVF